jgi:hypothetical protein
MKRNKHTQLQAKLRARNSRKASMEKTGGVRAYLAVVLVVGLLMGLLPDALFASSWNPTLLANTEAFQTIDDADTTANVRLKFGDTLGEQLIYDRSNQRFKFTRSLFVSGNGTFTGSVLVNIGNSAASPDTALEVIGVMSGSTVYATKSFSGAGLADCDTAGSSKLLWDATTGRFSCGTDQTGGASFGSGNVVAIGDARYVNTSGDTMTGALTINVTGGNNSTLGLKVINTLSGSIIHAEKMLRSSGSLVITTLVPTLSATSSGPNSPSTGADDNSVGTTTWSGTSDIITSNNVSAAASINAGAVTHYLKATNFGFSIPTGATITGIVVEWERRRDPAADVVDNAVRIVKGGSIGSTNKASVTSWPSSDAYASYGSSSDLWGETWTASDINASTFGSVLSAKDNAGDSTGSARVDHVRITVHYTDLIGQKVTTTATGGRLGVGTASPKTTLEAVGAISGASLHISGVANVRGALAASGSVRTDGDLTLNDDGTAGTDTVLTFGNATANQTLKFLNTLQKFQFSKALSVLGTISGSSLNVDRNATVGGTFTASGMVIAKGILSGSTVYATKSFSGAGLSDCDTGASSKLLWDASTGRFSCGTDQTGGASFGSGNVVAIGDARYVNTSGDTMTGALTIYKQSGTSTGNTLVVDTSGLVYDASNKRVGIGTVAPSTKLHVENSDTSSNVLQMLTISRTDSDSAGAAGLGGGLQFMLEQSNSASISAGGIDMAWESAQFDDKYSSMRFNVRSANSAIEAMRIDDGGRLGIGITAPKTKLEVQGTLSGNALLISRALSGAGLTDCDTGASSKLLWDATTGRFSCGTDQTGGASFGSGNVVAIGDARYVNTSGDTMTGTLTFQPTIARTTVLKLIGSGSYTIMGASGGSIIHTARGNPTLLATYDTAGSASRVAVSGRYAYVADGTSGLQIININVPGSPALVSTYDTAGTASDVFVAGRYAYVADNTAGVQIIDVSNPKTPVLVGTYNTAGNAIGIHVVGNYAYVADSSFGDKSFVILDVSNPARPVLVSTATVDFFGAQDVFVSGKYAYLAGSNICLVIMDISNPQSPKSVSQTSCFGFDAYGISVSGKYAYIAVPGYSVGIIDISNPASPSVTQFNTGGNARDVVAAGRYLYVADDTSGFRVVDISTPTSPVLVGTYDSSGTAYGVAVSGRYAYLADSTAGLRVVSINGLETPTVTTGNIDTDTLIVDGSADIGQNVAVRGGLNVGQGGLHVQGPSTVSNTASGSFALHVSAASRLPAASGALALSAYGSTRAPHIVFGSGNTSFDANLYRSAADILKTDDNFRVVGIMSGTTVYATKSFSGAGLSDCDTGASSKLLWDATTGRFSCGTDQTGGASGLVDHYVNAGGDTMTGSLFIAGAGKVLSASGNVITEGDLVINDDAGATDAVLTFGNATANQTLKFLNTLQKFQFSKALSVLGTLSGSSLNVDRNATIGGTLVSSGSLTVKSTISGSRLRIDNLSTSGALVYSSGASLRNTARGASGSLLVSSGTGPPRWAAPTGAFVWYMDGALALTSTGGAVITLPFGMTPTSVNLHAKVAPTGTGIVVNIKKNGTSIFSSKPGIYKGYRIGGTGAVFSTTDLQQGSVLTMDIDRVGSTLTGSGLTIQLNGIRKY